VGIRVAKATRSTGFIVTLQTYVLNTLGVRMVLQSLVVADANPLGFVPNLSVRGDR
jgi:hypothetical protein